MKKWFKVPSLWGDRLSLRDIESMHPSELAYLAEDLAWENSRLQDVLKNKGNPYVKELKDAEKELTKAEARIAKVEKERDQALNTVKKHLEALQKAKEEVAEAYQDELKAAYTKHKKELAAARKLNQDLVAANTALKEQVENLKGLSLPVQVRRFTNLGPAPELPKEKPASSPA